MSNLFCFNPNLTRDEKFVLMEFLTTLGNRETPKQIDILTIAQHVRLSQNVVMETMVKLQKFGYLEQSEEGFIARAEPKRKEVSK